MTSCAPEIPTEVVDAHKAPSVLDLPISDALIKHMLFPEWRRGSVADLPLAAGRDALSEGMPRGLLAHVQGNDGSLRRAWAERAAVRGRCGQSRRIARRSVHSRPARQPCREHAIPPHIIGGPQLDAGVRGIAPLLLFLAAGHTELSHLMIVEPELGLHPQQQIAVAELIGALVVGGTNVVVSTNSDYVVNAFNCMIRAASLESIGRPPENYSGPVIDKGCVEAAEFLSHHAGMRYGSAPSRLR